MNTYKCPHTPVWGLALGVDLSSKYTTSSAEKSSTTSCAACMEDSTPRPFFISWSAMSLGGPKCLTIIHVLGLYITSNAQLRISQSHHSYTLHVN